MSSNGDKNPTDREREDRDSIENKITNDSWLNIEIYVKDNHPELLLGLEQWLQLDLISQAQVKKIARNYLSCPLPIIEVADSVESPPQPTIEPPSELAVAFVPTNFFSQFVRNFLDELSIRWLLLLGVFLVVVSSGVLAASQWQKFPSFGQYLVLLIYTLGFGFVSWWTRQRELKLTNQTLSAIATLLVPVNFWAMNHLGLGNNSIEWVVVVVATLILTAMVLVIRRGRGWQPRFYLLFLSLGYLHLGWQVPLLVPLAIYGGIGIISLVYYRLPAQIMSSNLPLLLAAWWLLLARRMVGTITIASNYSLAIAIFAWLLATMALKLEIADGSTTANKFLSNICQIASVILLGGAWTISIIGGITTSPLLFAQTVGISVLAIHLLAWRLTLYGRKRDLTAIFGIGLQALYICKELIPDNIRTQAMELATAVTATEYFPESIFGVTLFPYIILWVAIASWLYDRGQNRLALYGEYLTLGLGIFLICLSVSNPIWRSLNLLLSTLTLGYVTRIRLPMRTSVVYLTHLLGLITIVNAIAVGYPELNRPLWGIILLVLQAIEWIIYRLLNEYRRNYSSALQASCWYFGLLLGTASYICFISYIEASWVPGASYWGLAWLITPAMLTLNARSTRSLQLRRLFTALSCMALIIAQALVWRQFETRFIGLAVASWLMYFNVFRLRRLIVTILHLGFVLTLIASLLSSFINNWNWLPVGSVAVLGLYWLRQHLDRSLNNPKFSYISQRRAHGILGVGVETQNFKSIDRYIKATDYWAIALITLELAVLSVIYLNIDNRVNFQYLSTTILLAGAVLWRYGKQPRNLALYTLVWLGELLVVGLLSEIYADGLLFATANIILSLTASICVAKLTRLDSPLARLNLACVPLVYATLGIFWRLPYTNAYTGILTLGAAFVLINTRYGDRQINRLFNYLGLAGISVGIYELAIPQLQSPTADNIADSMTILALVTAAIAFSYRLAAWYYRQRTRIFDLKLSRIIAIAHLHWAVASVLIIIAAGITIDAAPGLTSIIIATSLCLGAYALIQGRGFESKTNDGWVYIGIVELIATLAYSRLLISKLSFLDPGRIVFTCAIALLIYHLPWQNFGWRTLPWRRTASILPAIMALVTTEANFNLLITALFYARIAQASQNIRWSYLSLGAIAWIMVRFASHNGTEHIWLAITIGCSILYIAQFDSYYQSRRSSRHVLRLIGCALVGVATLVYQPGIVPSAIGLGLIFIGLGLKIRAFLFAGTITLIISVFHQLIILVLTYSFLKWAIGLITGIIAIAIAAGFEKQRDRAINRLQNYRLELQNWQ